PSPTSAFPPEHVATTLWAIAALSACSPCALVSQMGSALLIGAVVGSSTALILGGLTFLAMSLAFRPTVRLYDQTSLWGLTLPVIATLYLGMTLDSARRHRRGRGGEWKGRTQGGLSGGA
ncbi:MAG: hypothetical protein AAF220_10080, partial [Pseudomonadota bacterium]